MWASERDADQAVRAPAPTSVLHTKDRYCITGSGHGQPRWGHLLDGFNDAFDRGALDAPAFIPSGGHCKWRHPFLPNTWGCDSSVPREADT